MYDVALINGKVYVDKQFIRANVYIQDETIAELSLETKKARQVIDVNNQEIIPGIIDPHVHFALDLGRFKSVDTFKSGSKAAVYGGITTVIDFLSPTDTIKALEKSFVERLNDAQSSVCDYGFHATIAQPKDDLNDYVDTFKSLGISTLKLFTTYSESNRNTEYLAIEQLLQATKTKQFLLLAHIEDDKQINLNPLFTAKDLPKSRPTSSEVDAALTIAQLIEKTQGYLYMVHVSSGKTITKLREHYAHLLNTHFFLESCPQYFNFSDNVLKHPNGYLYTCAPPLRSKAESNALTKQFKFIDAIGTDHCAFNQKDKQQPLLKDIPLGIGSIEFSFPLMRHLFGEVVIDKMTKSVAALHGIKNKGQIKPGYDADLFIYQPQPNSVFKKHHGQADYSLYLNQPMHGKVTSTMIRGKFVMRNGRFIGGQGKYIQRRFDDERINQRDTV